MRQEHNNFIFYRTRLHIIIPALSSRTWKFHDFSCFCSSSLVFSAPHDSGVHPGSSYRLVRARSAKRTRVSRSKPPQRFSVEFSYTRYVRNRICTDYWYRYLHHNELFSSTRMVIDVHHCVMHRDRRSIGKSFGKPN